MMSHRVQFLTNPTLYVHLSEASRFDSGQLANW
jgi:hypothetical protein